MNWQAYIDSLKQEFPKFKIVPKDESRLMRFFNFFVQTFNPKFLETYTTVIGTTVYMPKWMIGTQNGVNILRHEAVHMRDSKKWGPLYYLSYCFLPIGPSFRAYWEFKAYKESLRVEMEQHAVITDHILNFYVGQFTGPEYLWMFPFPRTVRKWFEKARRELQS